LDDVIAVSKEPLVLSEVSNDVDGCSGYEVEVKV
jgi:hypothetical protein